MNWEKVIQQWNAAVICAELAKALKAGLIAEPDQPQEAPPNASPDPKS